MNTLAINRSDGKVRGAARGYASVCGFGGRAPIDHHKSPSAHMAKTSRPRRNLTGAMTRSGPFIRVGWAGDLNSIAALRIRRYSGLDERAATHIVEAEHSGAPGHFQCFPERDSHSSKSFRRPVLDSHDANENGLPHAQRSFAPGAKAHD